MTVVTNRLVNFGNQTTGLAVMILTLMTSSCVGVSQANRGVCVLGKNSHQATIWIIVLTVRSS